MNEVWESLKTKRTKLKSQILIEMDHPLSADLEFLFNPLKGFIETDDTLIQLKDDKIKTLSLELETLTKETGTLKKENESLKKEIETFKKEIIILKKGDKNEKKKKDRPGSGTVSGKTEKTI